MTVAEIPRLVVPNSSFRKRVEELSGEKVSACFQCEKCTNGCPLTFAMDIPPHKVIRSVHLGLKDEVLNSDTIWVCASCQTCTTRCPNGIDIAHIMDTLRQLSQREGIPASKKDVPVFHSAFLASMKRHGRVYEMGMAVEYTLRSAGIGGLMKQMGRGLEMMKKGKMKLLPARFRANSQVRGIFKKAGGKGKR
ncbi:MAG: heterodisulfide reductase subunit C [Chloroflexi bacterium CG07_land_8_20_14_0_80_51_10]|nr:MAG: heterodisulfide reductase subunit C [Chloroflexi bacterium CG07_land_8_20_14_0_80_51_10]